jgi:hypothetical protein
MRGRLYNPGVILKDLWIEFNSKYSTDGGWVESYQNLNINSSNGFNQSHPIIKESPSYRNINENPLVGSLDVNRLGATDKKFKLNVALRNSNQRLLKNVDFELVKKMMQKDTQNKGRPKDKLMLINDYNIKESGSPNRNQIMLIPQKPIAVYDWIGNVNKVLQPPSLQVESHSNYRDNYYNTLRGRPKAFNKQMGYFNYFMDKTKQEKGINQVYNRKHLSKYVNKLKDKPYSNNKGSIPRPGNAFVHPDDANTKYNRVNRRLDKSRGSSFKSKNGKIKAINLKSSKTGSKQPDFYPQHIL